jgi:hypothetical protein
LTRLSVVGKSASELKLRGFLVTVSVLASASYCLSFFFSVIRHSHLSQLIDKA